MFAQKSTISSPPRPPPPTTTTTTTTFEQNSLPRGSPTNNQRNFQPPPHLSDFLNPPSSTTTNDLVAAKLEQMLVELDRLIQHSGIITFSLLPPNHDICLVMRQIPLLISQSLHPLQTMLTFVEKIIYMLYKSNTTFALEAYTIFLQSLFDISPDSGKEALLWLVYADDERKYNPSVMAMLIRYQLLPLEEFDIQLAKLVQTKADLASDFAADLIRICLLTPNPMTNLEDHILTVSALRQQYLLSESSSRVSSFIDDLQQRVDSVYPNINLKDINRLELRLLLAEWNQLSQYPIANDILLGGIVKRILSATKDDDGKCFFLRMGIETCVQHYILGKPKAIQWVDALVKLMVFMVKLESSEQQSKMVGHIMSVIVLVLAQYHESMGSHFNQKPFFRLLSLIFIELKKSQIKCFDSTVLTCFSDALYTLQPLHFPGFAFSWLQLVSHRVLLPQLLSTSDRRGWRIYYKLVLCLLKFLGPLLEKQVLQTSTKAFYRGTLRLLVILLHDFPEFLCDYYMVFVQVIPHTCIQLRNMVLSAFPLVMHFPDPLTPDLCLGLLPECKEDPSIVMSFASILTEQQFHVDIKQFVQNDYSSFYKKALDFITTKSNISENPLVAVSTNDQQQYIREDALNALVLYIATHVIHVPLESNPAIKLYIYLIKHMSSQGTYLVLSAMADHLRYPNSHTQFFSQALLYLFQEMSQQTKEQITRILLERLIVNRPHPWGLLATFIGLIKEPNFWDYSFVRSSPEIERLFDNVARSIKRLS
ncbi:CCR4-Not complex component, Not1-domain-containing protein [Halteromyces radiatus]|uniref:CCR4-Not complex component, Not1-domain-containing protein n=1 Tax=Halteromyces radiatus TaxID=101107 RepID=UPI00222036BE|nr:CCR4-Not complex component, Not1-domain-containing protein [Halteromyces radiatus]KAI8089351.1 CCR4-Not complex component, Not1-domain-containing protein [Halteromyces radiatus]